MNILNLPELVDGLPDDLKPVFSRIYDISLKKGRMVLPKTMQEWAEKRFGNCEEQTIVRVTNKITYEGTLFNDLRSKRPIDVKVGDELEKIIKETEGGSFCNPLEQTPADAFGRVEGKYCITASNIAKYDYLHAVLIFNEHDPFVHNEDKIRDYLDTGLKWFKKANEFDKDAIFPFFMWNCLWRAAASLVHGHAQLLIADKPYSWAEFMKKNAEDYEKEYGTNYFDDLFKIHKSIGLGYTVGGKKNDVKIMANITPKKEKEIIMLSKGTDELPSILSKTLNLYYQLGVRSFTFAMFMPPLKKVKGWNNFPNIVKLVDRGDPMSRTADIGAMELYAGHSVVASDPFKMMKEIKSVL